MFGRSSKAKKEKSNARYGSSRPPSSGYVQHPAASTSTMTLRPHPQTWPAASPPPPMPAQYSLPLQQPGYLSSQPDPYQHPPPTAYRHPSPPAAHYPQYPVQSPYGSLHQGAWTGSTASVPNPVYPSSAGQSKFKSTVSLPAALVTGTINAAAKSVTNMQDTWNEASAQYLNQGSALCDLISTKLNDVITCIDAEVFRGDERDLMIPLQQQPYPVASPQAASTSTHTKSITTSTSHATSQNHFAKVWLYSNSRLPPYLVPCKFYISTYPLLCLAAQYSLQVYIKPNKRSEKEDHIAASVLHGTKAMTLKSLPLDDMNIVVFAIRGSQSFVDWAVNFRPAPTSPKDFLDDPGNLCHAGFLCVAKAMVKPVADRLRVLLQEDPSRSTASLLITGHSAGGAVAQLLYAHMMSEVVSSELTYLTSFFKRVHCVTFGAPPVSLLPLRKPGGKRHYKSMFFAFANEGDPVVRADKAVLKSLLKLLATPAPSSGNSCPIVSTVVPALRQGKKAAKRPIAPPKVSSYPAQYPVSSPRLVWKIPSSTLSCGGRIVLLREKLGARDADDVEACQVKDEELRNVVFGDPMCHTMALYARRVEILATRAVTAGGIAG